VKNFASMMKQAQQLQSRMAEMQAEIETLSVEGRAGGGLVEITLGGKGDVKSLKLDPSLLKPDEAEIVEDLVVAAHADAKAKLEALLQDKMQDMTGGLPLPPGMKLF
jgi:DNA-binding YbaB/EbfC family protein